MHRHIAVIASLILTAPALGADEPAAKVEMSEAGHFCEVVFGRQGPYRVSCFELSQTDAGPSLKGTAYAIADPPAEGQKMEAPPAFAEWWLIKAESYDPATRTLTYAYDGKMLRNDRQVKGTSAMVMPATDADKPAGWYATEDNTKYHFRLVTLAGLEKCLGVTEPAAEAKARYARVATSTEKQLAECAPAL